MVQPYPTGHDLQWPSHPIKTNTYNSAKIRDIELKLSEYDQMDYLMFLKRPTTTWFNLTQVDKIYNDLATQLKQM